MNEIVVATEMKLDVSIQMAVEQVLAQKFKECAKCTTHETNVNEFLSVNTEEPRNSSRKICYVRFFSVIKQIFTEFFCQMC